MPAFLPAVQLWDVNPSIVLPVDLDPFPSISVATTNHYSIDSTNHTPNSLYFPATTARGASFDIGVNFITTQAAGERVYGRLIFVIAYTSILTYQASAFANLVSGAYNSVPCTPNVSPYAVAIYQMPYTARGNNNWRAQASFGYLGSSTSPIGFYSFLQCDYFSSTAAVTADVTVLFKPQF